MSDSVLRTVLDNGLTVLIKRDASAPVVAINTYVKAGYFDETDDVIGIAHVLEHMYFKGTPTRGVGAIARETKASGGYLNAHTIYDHTSYFTVLPSEGFVAGLDVQFDAYANSSIDADELRRELEVIIQEAKRKADNPGAVTTETLYEVLHDRHRMRRWRIGREPGLRALTREQLVGFYRNFYRPSSTILAIVGDIDPDAALREATLRYGSLAPGEPRRTPGETETALPGFRAREMSGDIEMAHLAIGWRTPGTMHEDTPALDLAASVLGSGRASRLYRRVRERQLASSVSAYNYTPTDLGVFVVSAEAEGGRSEQALLELWAQVQTLRAHGVRDDELARSRSIFEARWLRRLESMEGQASHLCEWESLGSYALGDEYLARIQSMRPEDVTDAVRRHLDPEQASVVVYRPSAAPAIAADVERLRSRFAAVNGRAPDAAVGVPAVVKSHADVSLERVEAQVHVFRTRDGLPILVRRKEGAPIAHVGFHVVGGASEEPAALAGLTTLMTRTSIKGTARRDAATIASSIEALGGSVSPSAGAESFGWTTSVPTHRLGAAAEILADVVLEPTFPDDAFEVERRVAINGVAMLRDDMFRYPIRLMFEAAFGSHPYGTPVGGTDESLRTITVDDVRRWHLKKVLSSSGVLALVGDVDPHEAASMLAGLFERVRAADRTIVPDAVWPGEPSSRSDSRDKAQTALALGWPAPARHDPARFAVELIAGVASGLGGRFFEELRDKRSLGYTVHAYAIERRAAGMFAAYIATSPEREAEAREGLIAEVAKLRDVPVSDEELRLARSYALGTHAIRQQSGGDVLSEMVEAWLFGAGLHELESYESSIRAMTAQRMRDVAAEWFDDRRRVEGVVRGVGKAV